ncbi:hypothetical protein [Desulfuromonas thiophila]|uniref:Uncharacterized protein n=1 Tax=Desulfuromonas thiophila TaxID=57664 RepID=A0A1G6Z9N1_9BACT|nr:hypothetical protein [Desulfuromonas thiophila]SDD98585.1 hypothetical protein SAMN05661003_102326 [Desulfuromonas thiophila]
MNTGSGFVGIFSNGFNLTAKEINKISRNNSINEKMIGEKKMNTDRNFIDVLDDCFNEMQIDARQKDSLKKAILISHNNSLANSETRERLGILFEYEKNYLSLIKEYKEEIKFIESMQEDLRKERARFFSDTLKEVSLTMVESQIPSEVASCWIRELVNSYTKSLDVSSIIIEEHTFDTIGDIRNKAKMTINYEQKSEEK